MSTYIYGALAAVIVALGFWVQALRIEVGTLERDKAVVVAAAEKQAREHEQALSARERKHATEQQTKEQTYAKEKLALVRQRDSERADAGRLRDQLAVATTAVGATDAAACQRDRDRLASLGALAGEGVELVAEGQSLLRERAAEVKNLQAQIAADRAACSTKE